MGSYHGCLTCGASLAGKKRGTRGARQFCDKSCAQSYRNRLRATRDAPTPPPERGVRFVPLTQGKFARVDATDFADVSRWNWCVFQSGGKKGPEYAARGRTPEEIEATGKRSVVLLHRYLMGEPSADIDHRNGDGLDDRRKNLRIATSSQNGANSRSRKGTSKFKGVSRSRGHWRAAMRYNYKTIHLGRFDTEEEAARAHDEAARRLHGEFARVNFPVGDERSALQE